MTPEQEFAAFVGQEARKRGISYFLWAGNNDTLKFVYKTEIMSDKDGKIPAKLQASIDIVASGCLQSRRLRTILEGNHDRQKYNC